MSNRTGRVLSDLTGALAAGFTHKAASAKRVRAAVALALDFWTWRCLAGEGMSDEDAAGLMVAAAKAAAGG
jgi:hypothetical protein